MADVSEPTSQEVRRALNITFLEGPGLAIAPLRAEFACYQKFQRDPLPKHRWQTKPERTCIMRVSKRPGAHRSLLLDFLGFGFSDRPAGFPYSLREHALTAAYVLDHLGLEAVDESDTAWAAR